MPRMVRCSIIQASNAALTADLDLDELAEVWRSWQFYRDHRPDLYRPLVAS